MFLFTCCESHLSLFVAVARMFESDDEKGFPLPKRKKRRIGRHTAPAQVDR